MEVKYYTDRFSDERLTKEEALKPTWEGWVSYGVDIYVNGILRKRTEVSTDGRTEYYLYAYSKSELLDLQTKELDSDFNGEILLRLPYNSKYTLEASYYYVTGKLEDLGLKLLMKLGNIDPFGDKYTRYLQISDCGIDIITGQLEYEEPWDKKYYAIYKGKHLDIFKFYYDEDGYLDSVDGEFCFHKGYCQSLNPRLFECYYPDFFKENPYYLNAEILPYQAINDKFKMYEENFDEKAIHYPSPSLKDTEFHLDKFIN